MVLLLLVLLLVAPAAAQTPDPSRGTFEVRCNGGLPFSWRLQGGKWTQTASNQQALPMMDDKGEQLMYDFDVDAPADFWHRYRFSVQGVRAAQYVSGYTLRPELKLDVGKVVIGTVLLFAIVAGIGGSQFMRARRLRVELDETNDMLSEADARTGLFPVDGSIPSRIDRYEVVSRLGFGGMAVVYKVRRGGQELALKLPLPNLLDEEDFRSRFVREMKLGAALQHPNLVHIYDVNDGAGEFGYPYMVMELVTGLPLKERMALSPLSVPEVVKLGVQVLDALASIHGRGIVHRDLKPSNIMVTSAGNAKVMDFGIAYREETGGQRMTGTGDLLGTPLYLAPEQIGGDKQSTDPRIDIYGVGMVLYESLAGRLPWSSSDSVAAVLEKVSKDPPAITDFRRDVPPRVATCVMRMIARIPGNRYDNAAQARDALKRAMPG